MAIQKVKIWNYKIFEYFCIDLDSGVNIIVGDNEVGKSTVIEAIHLVLTGIINGKPLYTEMTQYLFNNSAVNRYLDSVARSDPEEPPEIRIEVFFNESDEVAFFKGKINKDGEDAYGITLVIALNDENGEYAELIKSGTEVKSIPIEYYEAKWSSFADKIFLSTRSIPIKSALVDSSLARYQNGSDIYVSRIVRQRLEKPEIVGVSQAHRRMRESFMNDPAISALNQKIKEEVNISDKKVELSVELLTKNAWENSLVTYIDEVPFHYIGKGEQSIIKTKLALTDKKAIKASVVLMEEPENHLTYPRLNQLIENVSEHLESRQIIITTHSSFVANKLGIDRLVLLSSGGEKTKISLLSDKGQFFKKLPGYDTLRLVLCQKAILVEGPSDELIVQRAYRDLYGDKLPIEDGIDVISVGTSFLRFLEIADNLKKYVTVVTDNDGNIDALKEKYKDYLGDNSKDYIMISYDPTDQTPHSGQIDKYNYNTLENLLLGANNLSTLNNVLGKSFSTDDELRIHMKANKTECALSIFESDTKIDYPSYITEAITHVRQ